MRWRILEDMEEREEQEQEDDGIEEPQDAENQVRCIRELTWTHILMMWGEF
jgi:hypothetical protein